jgi:hypothetical protein
MAKWAPNAFYSGGLGYLDDADLAVLCSAQPANYTEATTTYALADVALSGGDFTEGAGDVDGRKMTIAAKSAVDVDATGAGTHIALVSTSDEALRYVTTCTSTNVTSGGTVDLSAWDVEIGAPT